MKRCVRLAPLALVLAALSGGACRKGDDAGLIVASGHVEATEVLVSTKVAGTHRVAWRWTRGTIVAAGQEIAPHRHDRHRARPRRRPGRPRPGRGRAAPAARRLARRGRPRGRGPGRARGGRPRGGGQGPRAHGGAARRGLRHHEVPRRRPHAPRRGRGRPRRRPRAPPPPEGRLPAGGEGRRARPASRRADARIAQLEQQVKDALVASPVAASSRRSSPRRASSPPGARASSW